MAAGRLWSSLNCTEHQGWLSLWAANVPSKVKVHYWRLAKNGLAVGEELRRRNIKQGVRSIACNREELIFHRFWSCPHSSRIWELLRERTLPSLVSPRNGCRSQVSSKAGCWDALCVTEREGAGSGHDGHLPPLARKK